MAAEIAGTTDQALRISANMIITCSSESPVTLESGCEKSVKNGKSSYKFLQTTCFISKRFTFPRAALQSCNARVYLRTMLKNKDFAY